MAGSPILRWLLLAVLSLTAAAAQALEVRETIWGFDGTVVPGRFNPFSVLVDNPHPTAFDGQLVLSPSEGGGRRGGTEYVQPVFLAPRTARWVQFQVFIGNSVENHILLWGPGAKERYEFLAEAKLGPPACVWLRDTANPFAPTGALKSFPDELFPTTVAATDALDAVVLDHMPGWEPARRAAFLDWLKRGGTLHLLPAPDGRHPVFTDDLAVLNGVGEVTPLGTGRVVRHQIGAREMSEKFLAEHGYPPRTLKQSQNPMVYDLETLLPQRLSALTRPTVSWTAIHLLALAYVVVIGPLHYRFRRKFDYRWSIVLFLGVVAVFAAAFALVGRRGYGESQTVHSLGIAHSLGGGRHDVTQWISAFAVTGDFYTLTHAAPANLYSTGWAADDGGSRAFNGKDGRIEMDIPLYSSRSFVHRAVMTGSDTSVTVERWRGEKGDLRGLRLRPGPGFPKDFTEAQVFVDDSVFALVLRDGIFEVSNQPAGGRSTYFLRDKLSPLIFHDPFIRDREPDAHRKLMPLLAARALGAPDVFQQNLSAPPKPADHLQLCIVAPAPAAFHLRGAGFERERGWVLYVQDVFKP